MNILDAAHRIGHEYPGGMDSLAPRIDCNPRVLNAKLNPNCKSHHLTLLEALRLQQLTNRADILFAEADVLGYVCLPRPEVSDANITTALTRACSEFGDYMREADKALSDDKITPNEVKRLEKELAELMTAAAALQAAIVAKGRKGR